jgi:hypothetical protein
MIHATGAPVSTAALRRQAQAALAEETKAGAPTR